ncbi:MAG: hypothetical protein AAGN66_13165 [Acidobacteriota bacterium]
MHPRLARTLYFGLQRLRREPVSEALADVRRTEFLGRDELLALQAERQLAQLRFAARRVPYYRETYAPFLGDLERARTPDDVAALVRRLPTVAKGAVVEQRRRFRAEGRIGPTYPDRTSGSSGTPLAFPCDQTAWAYRHALTWRTLEAFGARVGDPYGYFFGLHWSRRGRFQVRLRDWLFNRTRISAFDLGPSNLERHWRQLRRFGPRYFLGYPSALAEFCALAAQRGYDLEDLHLKAVMTTGEPLRAHQRTLIESTTGAPCANLYGSAEGGLGAFGCPAGSLHVAVEASWLDVAGSDSETGDGGEAIVTDLFLRAFPLIRYAIGDGARRRDGICPCGRAHPMIADLEGRSGKPIQLPNGRRVNANLPSYVFKPFADGAVIRRYRFVETPKGLTLLLAVDRNSFTGEHLAQVRRETHRAFGDDLDLEVEILDTLPTLPNAKHRDYVPLDRGHAQEAPVRNNR